MTELHLSVNILNRDNILKYQHITKEKKGRERNEKHKNNNFAGLILAQVHVLVNLNLIVAHSGRFHH